MKKLLMMGTALAVLAATPAAMADGDLFATTLLNKDIFVTENIRFEVDVELDVDVNIGATKFAQSIALANQVNAGNSACQNCAEKEDIITGSGNNNTGVISINQAAGNMNNSGTLISAAIDALVPGSPPGDDGDPDSNPEFGFAEAKAGADQRNGLTEGFGGGEGGFGRENGNTVDTVNILYRDAIIAASLKDNEGLVYANQATGNMANQVNVLSLAFSLAENGVALAEADLGQVNIGNDVEDGSNSEDGNFGIEKLASVTGSLNGNIGIFGVNQSVGNMSNQANVVSVAAVGAGLPTF
jgi:hypothetical protein